MLENSPVHSPEHSPPQWGPGAWEDEEAELPFLEFDLGLPPELGPDINHFLQQPASSARKESGNDSSLEPLVGEYQRWVTWQGWALDTPDWWQELAEIPDVDDHWELARKVQASFKLLQWISKLHGVENYHLVPPAPHVSARRISSCHRIQSSTAMI